MRTMTVMLILVMVAACGALDAASTVVAGEKTMSRDPVPTGKLDMIKKLAGDWVEIADDGTPTGKVISTFRVTAGGNAVEETLFAGTDHEMITLYHLDGDDLALTHYCVSGNHPRMKAEAQQSPDRLEFRCARGGTMKSENDQHMHHATIVWRDENHIRTEWREFSNGENTYTATFNLARR
jgi:hypothetical protein